MQATRSYQAIKTTLSAFWTWTTGEMKVTSAQTIANLPDLQRTASNLFHLETTAKTGLAAKPKQNDTDNWYLLEVLTNWDTITIEHQLSVAQLTSRCVTLYPWHRQFTCLPADSAYFQSITIFRHMLPNPHTDSPPLPNDRMGYSRILLAGTTGAGKTTLLRHILGTRHSTERFPSTSTAKTTIAEFAIVQQNSAWHAHITFMPKKYVRDKIEECLEHASLTSIKFGDGKAIAESLLESHDQRFRLSYILGRYEVQDNSNTDADFAFDDTHAVATDLDTDELVTSHESKVNFKQVSSFVDQIKVISDTLQEAMEFEYGRYQQLQSPESKEEWEHEFVSRLAKHQGYSRLLFLLLRAVESRFINLERLGTLNKHQQDGWPTSWTCKLQDRKKFLKQLNWFTGNHYRQMGKLLTPLVERIRVSGPFYSMFDQPTRDSKLVLLDGEGIGHSAREASSVSTRLTQRFSEVNCIVLVENASSPMQAASLALLKSVGISGHASKLAIVFTHFDHMQGDNLNSHTQKQQHAKASITNAIDSLTDTVGRSVVDDLESVLLRRVYFLGGLDRETEVLPIGYQKELQRLIQDMQSASVDNPIVVDRPNRSKAVPSVSRSGGRPAASNSPLSSAAPGLTRIDPQDFDRELERALLEFNSRWNSRLNIRVAHSRPHRYLPEHWARIKALSRRIALCFDNYEYNHLKPVAELIDVIQTALVRWSEDLVPPPLATDRAKSALYDQLHKLVLGLLVADQHKKWQEAYMFRGRGSTKQRASLMSEIFGDAASIRKFRRSSSSNSSGRLLFPDVQ